MKLAILHTMALHIGLDDSPVFQSLLPICFTRPVWDIRIGLYTFQERIAQFAQIEAFKTADYLEESHSTAHIWVLASVLVDAAFIAELHTLDIGESLVSPSGCVLASRTAEAVSELQIQPKSRVYAQAEWIERPWQIFQKAGRCIELDCANLSDNRHTASASNRIFGQYPVFIEEGVWMECAILNAEKGPIYIGKGAVIQENACIRGPFVVHAHSEIKMGSKMYGPSSIGPHSKFGGETTNIVVQGYSNKGHDGYLGNAVLGEWCNLGADTNSSNLKNNYSIITAYSYAENKEVSVGDIFCGLIMGDHSKAGINTMFNTATIVGVSANIFGAGFTPKHIPSFTWGGIEESKPYSVAIALKVAEAVMQRRSQTLSEKQARILRHIFTQTHEKAQ